MGYDSWELLNKIYGNRYCWISVLSLLVMSAVIAITSNNSGQSQMLSTSRTIQMSQGVNAVLTSEDFVPLGDSSDLDRSTKTSRAQMRMLYAAAGMKMARPSRARFVRKQQLTDVSDSVMYPKPRKYMDMTALHGLNMASKGYFPPDNAIHLPDSREALRARKIQRALGDTIAKYFSSQQKP